MIRTFKYLFPMLTLPLWGCSTSDPTEHAAPEAGTIPIVWNVGSVSSPGSGSRALVGPEFDSEGRPYTERDWTTIEQTCTPQAAGGEGKAIGIWADYAYTDERGDEVVMKNLFSGTRLIYADKPGGNPHSWWNYEGDDLYWFLGGSYKFRAYFPQELGQNVISSATATTFVIEYPTHEMQEDLLLAYNRVDTTDPQVDLSLPVKLDFSHGLAAIRFLVKADFANTDQLTSCYLQNVETQDFATSGILAYGTDTDPEAISWVMGYYPPATERIYYWENAGVEFSYDGAGTSHPALAYSPEGCTAGELFTRNNGWVLILPQASSGRLQFCFTTRNGEEAVYRVTIPQITERIQANDGSLFESTEYRPGRRYTYTISITKTDLELSLTVADWNLRESSHSIVF